MQKLIPFLWFDDTAEAAAAFYVSLFKESRIVSTARYGDAAAQMAARPKNSVMTVTFELMGQEFIALNGGPVFQFTEAISFLVSCKTQEEVDELWEKLSDGGEKGRCGWLKDKYGVSWQIVPAELGELLNDTNYQKAERVMEAMLQMGKLDMRKLKQAYDEA